MNAEWWIIGIIVVGCFVLIIRGLNGNASHILTAVVSYLFGSKSGKRK